MIRRREHEIGGLLRGGRPCAADTEEDEERDGGPQLCAKAAARRMGRGMKRLVEGHASADGGGALGHYAGRRAGKSSGASPTSSMRTGI